VIAVSHGPFVHDAYGQHTRAEGEQPTADAGEEIAEGFDQLFQGMRFDPKDSFFHERPRAFSPTLKDWANHEPLAYVEGLNLYTALPDNPIHAVNPLGE
jgi:RHS repeat-associated protein